ncbi:hypothetical protein ACH4TQ_50205 [Streptomyces sp. NPDC021218]|uniref:hypothetical protein n=1 Tax=Streptomyces sp. NPDC021218 TaxID=3365119 RepID=UPI003787DC6A
MPTTNTDNTTPDPSEPVQPQLSGAHAAVWAALNNQPGATSTALAQAADVGRSTTTKALRHFEQTGLARRESAAPVGTGRPTSYWFPTLAPDHEANAPAETPDEPTTDHPTHTTEPLPSSDDTSEDAVADDGDEQQGHEGQTESLDEPAPETEDNDTPPPAPAPEPPVEEAAPPAAPDVIQPTNLPTSHKARLAPGALRDMVIDHLTAHPNEAFTATRISRAIEKSSGAIANALVTLTKQGTTEQITERPRTYRLTTAPSGGDK